MEKEILHVTAKGLADLGKLIGGRRGELTIILPPGSTLHELLAALIERCGPALARRIFQQDGLTIRKDVRLLLNGRDIAFLNGLATELQEGDHFSMIPPLAGG